MEPTSPSPLSQFNHRPHRQHYHFSSPDQSQSQSSTNLPNNPPSTSLLSQWLEQSHLNNNNISSRSVSSSSHQLHHYSSQPQYLNTRSTGSHNTQQGSNTQYSYTTTNTTSGGVVGAGERWTDSAVYVGRSSSASVTSSTSKSRTSAVAGQPPPTHQHHLDITLLSGHIDPLKMRTMSDSFYALGGNNSQESLDQILLPEDEAAAEVGSQTTTTSRSHCSQSLSLGSSLDNLLLVDSQSQHSGLSPNSTHRISVSSCTNNNTNSSHSPSGGLAGLCNYDPDVDGDVFITEVTTLEDHGDHEQGSSTASASLGHRLEDSDDKPPELPKKKRQFLIGSNNGGVTPFGEHGQTQARCPSPYDNVDEASPEHSTWHGEGHAMSYSKRQNYQQHKQFMSYSESRTTLVGIAGTGGNGTDIEDRPPLPPKKKHSSKSIP